MDSIRSGRLGFLVACLTAACASGDPGGGGPATTTGALSTPSPLICTGKKALDCSDNNPCTQDCYSKSNGGCVHVALTGGPTPKCSDNNACSTNDHCWVGKCVGTSTCNDNNACTSDSCNPATGCVFTDASAACDDGNQCTSNSCDPATGCVYTNTSDACDDGTPCTTKDTCAGGSCSGAWKDCDDGDVCTNDSCDKATGDCMHAPMPSHDKCVKGDPLSAACTSDACVVAICETDKFCCVTAWDGFCVNEVSSICGLSCN